MVHRKLRKKDIFKNKQPKLYQSSKILALNEWAWRKKKKEPKIAKNSGEMKETQNEREMAPFVGWSSIFVQKWEKEDDLGILKHSDDGSTRISRPHAVLNRRKKEKK